MNNFNTKVFLYVIFAFICYFTSKFVFTYLFLNYKNPVMRVSTNNLNNVGTYQLGHTTFGNNGFTFEVLCEQPGIVRMAAKWYVPLIGTTNANDALQKAIGDTITEAAHHTNRTYNLWTTADNFEWIHQEPYTIPMLSSISCGDPILVQTIIE